MLKQVPFYDGQGNLVPIFLRPSEIEGIAPDKRFLSIHTFGGNSYPIHPHWRTAPDAPFGFDLTLERYTAVINHILDWINKEAAATCHD